MSDRKWTPEQQQAIEARGGDLLVSAAAGSGKTAVLTERVISLITDPAHPLDIDRLLIVTFSNAAAAEMRQRIAARLYDLLEECPEDATLRRQILLLGGASISTIHSFCFRLIRENFQLLGLPGDLRLGDDREMNLMRQKVAAALLEEEYSQGEEAFLRLVELLSKSRTDQKVQETILTLYDFIRNHPFYEDWVAHLLQQSEEPDFDKSVWCRILKGYAAEALDDCLRELQTAKSLCQGFSALEEKVLPLLNGDIFMLEDLRGALGKEWDICCEKAAAASFPRFPTIKAPESLAAKEEILGRRRAVAATLLSLKKNVFLMTQEHHKTDMEGLRPLTEKLFSLVLRFDALFREEKLLHGKLDYSDLEHDSLRLLWNNGTRSELAERLSGQYTEILMDEYQDTNAIQEKIFSAIAGERTPRFMVGDVKQSIYRFRQACPEIFLAKKQEFAPYDGTHFPAKISLAANFRTRREITGFVNRLFQQIMNPAIGEMEYLPEDALQSRLDYDYSVVSPVNFLALEAPKEWNREQVVAAEAERVAAEIAALLHSGFPVKQGEGSRPCEPKDFCILMRATKAKAEVYREALGRRGLMGRIEQREGFLASREITPILSYLKVLENPMLDLELSAVLMSPLYGCTGDDIAGARMINRRQNLFLTIQMEPCAQNPRFAAFLRDYEELRPQMQSLPGAQLIREICRRTDYQEKCSVLPEGTQALSNLRLLMEYAADYEQSGRTENNFIGYLSRLEEYGYDLPAASTAVENTISIMTVHKSKGLEFPVVFLVDLAGGFNTEDQKSDISLHRELGFACKLRDNRTMQQHKTLPLAAMQLENRRASLSEEMRILYVALTRPREKLYLVAAKAGLGEKMEAAASLGAQKMSSWQTRSAASPLDWLLPSFAAASAGEEAELNFIGEPLGKTQNWVEPSDHREESPGADQQRIGHMKENIGYRYPYLADTVTPRRISVSELAEQKTQEEFFFHRRPKTLTAQGLSAAERGTAAHKVMQFANYAALERDPEGEMQRLVQEGFLFREEGSQLDATLVTRLLETELGRRILHADHVYREIRFLQEFTPEELRMIDPSLVISGKTVLMGAVDCVLIEQGKAVIVDYKTDRVKDGGELLRRYTAQVRLYRAITERRLGIPVKEIYLYSFALGMAIPVEV